MSDGPQKSPTRARREWEDTLLQGRTAIFLVLNGFAVQKPIVAVAVAITAIDCLWIVASVQSWIVIRDLVRAAPQDAAQGTVDHSLGTKHVHRIFRPTTIVALWIPTLTYVGWLTFIGVGSASYLVWIAVAVAMLLPFLVLWALRSARGEA